MIIFLIILILIIVVIARSVWKATDEDVYEEPEKESHVMPGADKETETGRASGTAKKSGERPSGDAAKKDAGLAYGRGMAKGTKKQVFSRVQSFVKSLHLHHTVLLSPAVSAHRFPGFQGTAAIFTYHCFFLPSFTHSAFFFPHTWHTVSEHKFSPSQYAQRQISFLP